MDQERLNRMGRAMETAQLDALLLRLPENVVLLSGYWPMIGLTYFLFPREGEPICIAPHCYENEVTASLWQGEVMYYRFGVLGAPDAITSVSKLLRDLEKTRKWATIGYEGNFPVLAPSWNSAEVLVPTENSRKLYESIFTGAQLVDVSDLLQSERRRKTPLEIEKLKAVSEISCIGLSEFHSAVEVGATGVQLAAVVEQKIMAEGTGYRGATRVRAYAQIACGPAESALGYRPNEISTTRPLESGDIALLELAVVMDGFWADRTRVRVAGGRPSEVQMRVFQAVHDAQEAGIAAIRPGVTCGEVDAAARTVIEQNGFGEHFPHITGHGTGIGYHESAPILAPGSDFRLEEGMLTSVEPGVYFEPMGGIRLEDDVLVTESGSQVLGPFEKSLN